MKKILLTLMLMASAILLSKSEDWNNYLIEQKKEMYNVYFQYSSTLIVKILKLKIKDTNKINDYYYEIENKKKFFSEGVFVDHEGKNYIGFRWIGMVFLLKEVDYYRLRFGNDDFICYADFYHVSADSESDFKKKRINNLSSLFFVYTIKKKMK